MAKCGWNLQIFSLALAAVALAGCSKASFDTVEDSPFAYELKCVDSDDNAPGPKITQPAANRYVRPNIRLEGTCEGNAIVRINGKGLTAPVDASCDSGRFQSDVILTSTEGLKSLLATQDGIPGGDKHCMYVDTTPPRVLVVPASTLFNTPDFTVTGECERGGSSVELHQFGVSAPLGTGICDDGLFSIPVQVTGDGVKNIVATQLDEAGNQGSDQQDYNLDTTPPAVRINEPLPMSLHRTGVTVRGVCEAGLSVVVSGNAVYMPVTTLCSMEGDFSADVLLAGIDGLRTINAQQVDLAGNIGRDEIQIFRDTVPPTVAISSPAAGTVAATGVILEGTCTEGLLVNLSGPGLDVRSTASCKSGGVFAVPVTFSAGEGEKTVIASQTDLAGNVGSDIRNFIRDSVAPVVVIQNPAAGSSSRGSLTLSGTCESGLPVQVTGAITAAQSVVCSNGQFSAGVTLSSPDGNKIVEASQTDLAGNRGSDRRDFTLNSVLPMVAITAPAAGTVARDGLTVSGTCSNGYAVDLRGAGLASPMTVTCAAGRFTASILFSSGDGVKNVIAEQTDGSGYVASSERSFVRDTTAPNVLITAPNANSESRGTLTLEGICESGLAVEVRGDVTAVKTVSCTGGVFQAAIALAGADGAKNVVVSQTDEVGNSGSANRNFVLDTTAPRVAFSAPEAGTATKSGLNLQGTCESGLPVQLSGAGLSASGSVSCANGVFNASVTLSTGDGVKTIVATQIDAVGNVGSDSRDFELLSAAPVVEIRNPAAGTLNRGSLTISGVCKQGLRVRIEGAGVRNTSFADCTAGAFSALVSFTNGDGSKNVVVSQKDKVGNIGTDNRSFLVDATAPIVTIATPTNGTSITNPFTVTGTCEAGLAVYLTGDIQAPGNTMCVAGQYSISLAPSSGGGSKKVTATQTDAIGNEGSDTRNYTYRANRSATENFVADRSEGKVDILVVDDNSASMEFEQRKLGQRFPSFVTELQGLDWQLGVTTTDCSPGPWGICGSLLPLTGATGSILNPKISGYEAIFRNTIERPETVDCVLRGECPSGLEEALKATVTAMEKRNTNNAGFFREGAALAVLILMDEDEQSSGPSSATKPQAVVDRFNSIWGRDKKMRAYAITTLTGDAACLQMQKDQQGGIGAYGTHAIELARITSGSSASICEADYSAILGRIGSDLRTVTNAVTLSRTPLVDTVRVEFTPSQNITFTVRGNTVLFSSPVPAGTRIRVTYEY